MNDEKFVNPVSTPSRLDGVLDVGQAITGVCLVIFMWTHMLFLATVLVDGHWFDLLAEFLEHYYLAQAAGPIIVVLILIHMVLAGRKFPATAGQVRVMSRHSKMMKHGDTKLWTVQIVTAVIIMFMVFAHVWVVMTTLPITAEQSAARIQSGWVWFYLILLPVTELHVGIGFVRVLNKWGILNRKTRKFGKVVEWLILLGFLILGLAILRAFWVFELGG